MLLFNPQTQQRISNLQERLIIMTCQLCINFFGCSSHFLFAASFQVKLPDLKAPTLVSQHTEFWGRHWQSGDRDFQSPIMIVMAIVL
jgi:hypothetical protein